MSENENLVTLTEDQKNLVYEYCGYPRYSRTEKPFKPSWPAARIYDKLTLVTEQPFEPIENHLVIVCIDMIRNLKAKLPHYDKNYSISDPIVFERIKNGINLYNGWRKRFCQFIDIPPGPGIPEPM